MENLPYGNLSPFYLLKLCKPGENYCELLLPQNKLKGFLLLLLFNERDLALLMFISHLCFELVSALPLWLCHEMQNSLFSTSKRERANTELLTTAHFFPPRQIHFSWKVAWLISRKLEAS